MSELLDLARYGTSSPQLLDDLAHHGDAELQRAVAANGATGPDTLDWLSRRRSVAVRVAVAANADCPLPALRRLASAQEQEVRSAVAQGAGTPREMRVALMTDADPSVRQTAARALTAGPDDRVWQPRAPQPHCYRAVDDEAKMVLESLVEDPEAQLRGVLAACLTASPAALQSLACDADPGVRTLVAGHPLVEPDLLEFLSDDSEPAVRMAVVANPWYPAERAAEAASSPDTSSRVGAAMHPLQDSAVLEQLCRDSEVEVAATAVRHPSLPLATVWEVACGQPATPRSHKGAKLPFAPVGSLRDYAEHRLAHALRGKACACGARMDVKPFPLPGPALDHREPSRYADDDGTVTFLKAWCTGPCGREWRFVEPEHEPHFAHPDDALVEPVATESVLGLLLGPWGALEWDAGSGRAVAWGHRLADELPERLRMALSVDTGCPLTYWAFGELHTPSRHHGHGLVMVRASRADAPRLYGRYGGDDFERSYSGELRWAGVHYGDHCFTSLAPDDDELADLLERWQAEQREREVRARLDPEQARRRERENAEARKERAVQALALLGGPLPTPDSYGDCLGPFEAVVFDGYCGEATGWGHRLTRRIGDERFHGLRAHGELVCFGPGEWVLVTRELTPGVAQQVHGPVTHVERGPRGGWRWVRYGDTMFDSRALDPDR